jgi:hypothetical protein
MRVTPARAKKGMFMYGALRSVVLLMLILICSGAAIAEAQSNSLPANSGPSADVEDAETHLRSAVITQVGELWAKADFAGLDSMADGYVRTKERTLSGKW